jgi:hypothetical protein
MTVASHIGATSEINASAIIAVASVISSQREALFVVTGDPP